MRAEVKQEKLDEHESLNSADETGWEIPNERVPSGWRIKYFDGIFDYKYLTKDLKIIESTEEAFNYIQESGQFNHIIIIKFGTWVSEVEKMSPAFTWIQDPSLPPSWYISSGLEKDILKNKSGSRFESRIDAIDHMIKENYTPTDIFKLWNTLHLEGWVGDDENLPTGWKRKYFPEKNVFHYLSPMMQIATSGNSLLDLVKERNDYTETEIAKVKNWVNKNK